MTVGSTHTKALPGTLRNHFSTLGVNGVNRMIRNFSQDRDDITTAAGHAMAERLLDHVRARIIDFQTDTGHLYNLEATPAEGTTCTLPARPQTLARHPPDRQRHQPYYTNSSQLPAGFTDDPSTRSAARKPCKANTPAAPCCICICTKPSPRRRHAKPWCNER